MLISQITSLTQSTRQLSESQIAALAPLVGYLADWTRMGFTTEDSSYRLQCRANALAGIGERLAAGLLGGSLAESVEKEVCEITQRSCEGSTFREAFAAEISAVLSLTV
jgi:hypothetical protein